MHILFIHHLIAVVLRYGSTRVHLTKEEEKWVGYGLIFLFLVLLAWGIIAVTRYFFRAQMVRRKMKWSAAQDSFWNYDNIIEAAKSHYIKAQVLLNTRGSTIPSKLSPYAKARLRLFKKKVVSEKDITFLSAYIVCFDDKKNNSEDSVAVYPDIKVKGAGRFEEILVMHRERDSWIISDYVKNPAMFMISHARSIVEKS